MSPPSPRPPHRPLGRATLRRRRTRSRPEHGWGLIGRAADRLGIGDMLHGQLACRAFAVALHRLLPRLEPQARAEQLQAGTLSIRVSSSAVASELVYVKDMLLEGTNQQLGQLAAESAPASSRRRLPRTALAIERLAFRVGPVKALPAYADWVGFAPRSRKPEPPRPAWDLGVASEVAHVADDDLRQALQALYGAATNPSPPDSPAGKRPAKP